MMRPSLLLPTLAYLVVACADQGVFAPTPTDEVPELTRVAAPGEEKSFEINVEFVLQMGRTVADERGLTFIFRGREITDDELLYPEEYWGEYALYFPGQPAQIGVLVTNLGPRQNARLRAVTEAYAMNLDGSNGEMIKPPEIVDEVLGGVPFDLAAGETGAFWGSFRLPQAGKGLNRFVVKLYHRNEGGGPGNEEPAWIMTREGIFCPFDPAEAE